MNYKINNVYNCDCLAAMHEIPDKYFELAIVDPPYGGGAADAFEGGGLANKGSVAVWGSL